MNKQIRQAFSPLHADENTLACVLARTHRKGARRGRVFLAAAALAAVLTATAFAADYILNDREVFFFDTLDALAAKQQQDHPGSAAYYGVPGTAEESEQIETSTEYVARVMERGLHEEQAILTREDAENGRLMIAEYEDPDKGTIRSEYQASAALADSIQVDGLLDWDVSFLQEEMTPDTDGQILALGRSAEDGQLLWVKAHLGYTPQTGKRFSLSYEYTPDFDYGENPEYVLSSAYDRSEIFTTQDQVQVLVQEFDGQVWANAARGCKSVYIYTNGCTFEQVESYLDQLGLADVLS